MTTTDITVEFTAAVWWRLPERVRDYLRTYATIAYAPDDRQMPEGKRRVRYTLSRQQWDRDIAPLIAGTQQAEGEDRTMATRIYTKATYSPQVCSHCQKPISRGQRMATEFTLHVARGHYHEFCWDVVSTRPPYFIPPQEA